MSMRPVGLVSFQEVIESSSLRRRMKLKGGDRTGRSDGSRLRSLGNSPSRMNRARFARVPEGLTCGRPPKTSEADWQMRVLRDRLPRYYCSQAHPLIHSPAGRAARRDGKSAVASTGESAWR
jgi:hypothetical protein